MSMGVTALADFVGHYPDLDTGFPRNCIGATTQQALDLAEADCGLARALKLIERPVKATGGMRQLQAIHHRLFQDVDEWARSCAPSTSVGVATPRPGKFNEQNRGNSVRAVKTEDAERARKHS